MATSSKFVLRRINAPIAMGVLMVLVAAAGLAVNAVEMDIGSALFSYDTFAIYRPYLDITRFDFPISGWRTPVAPFYFPDYILFFILAFGLPVVWVFPAVVLTLYLISAAGWTLVCRNMGGNTKMQASVWFIHALQLALLSYPANDFFILLIVPLAHVGTWVFIPWLIWAVLDIRRRWLLFGLLALFGASNIIVVTWFVVPALFAITLAVFFKRYPFWLLLHWLVIFALALVSGKLLAALLPFVDSPNAERFVSPDFAKLWDSVVGMTQNLMFIANEYLLLTLIWLAFVGLVLLIITKILCQPTTRSFVTFKRFFLIVFIPAAMVCPVAAQVIVGIELNEAYQGIDGIGDSYFDLFVRARYIAPFLYLPLFIGWCFLPFYFQKSFQSIKWRLADSHFSLALCLLLVVVAAPRLANAFDEDKVISPFNTPFDVCLRQAANRLGWTGAIGIYRFWNRAVIDPDNPIRQNIVVEALPQDSAYKNIPFFVSWDFTNRHWYSGEFQVVAINTYQGKHFLVPPRTVDDACQTDSCLKLYPLRSVTETLARAAWGEPAEIVECEGIALFHYDPPIRYDLADLLPELLPLKAGIQAMPKP